tara:strand:+ start:48 stop:347 length:300 start_codon:yes stop_codon:yes gene_type:complete
MGRETTFKPVDLDYRGTAYQKHHKKMVGGSKRFISDTACPKCGEYLRVWRSQRNGEKTSTCKGCYVDKKNKSIDNTQADKRRAIEAHQERTNDLDWELM